MSSRLRIPRRQKSKLCHSLLFLPLLIYYRYCNRIHVQSETPSPVTNGSATSTKADENQPSVYHTLLSLYLTPPSPYEPNWPPALDLLSKHGPRLPALSTLGLMPGTLPVKDLERYFRSRIRAANSIVNEARVVAGLRKSEMVCAQAALLGEDDIIVSSVGLSETASVGAHCGRSRHVVVSEERVCGVCHKRLGRSVVSVLPNNAVVHYACSKSAALTKPGSWNARGLGSFRKDSGGVRSAASAW